MLFLSAIDFFVGAGISNKPAYWYTNQILFHSLRYIKSSKISMQTRMFEGCRSGGNFQQSRHFKRCIKPEKAYLTQLTKGAQEKGSMSAIFC